MSAKNDPKHITGTLTDLLQVSAGSGDDAAIRAQFGFFNCHGGVSREPFGSLNVGFHVGDRLEDVLDNREKVKNTLQLDSLSSIKQVHGSLVYHLESDGVQDIEVSGVGGYDAIITDKKGVGLMVQHADCQGVLLYDPVKEAIGAVHSGWRGNVQNIIQITVDAMVGQFGVHPGNLQAMIGPSLGPCCGEFRNYKEELPREFEVFMVQKNYFNFWEISKYQLTQAGLARENIQAIEICTACSKDYFSYRRACRQTGGVTGRNCSVIALG